MSINDIIDITLTSHLRVSALEKVRRLRAHVYMIVFLIYFG